MHIFSRNLTPYITGLPDGGNSLSEFLHIMKTGKDFDTDNAKGTGVHPNCPTATQTAHCVPYPFDGGLLQIMPWPAYQDMTDHELTAIYEYLKAIPCIDTKVDGQPQLRNNCPAH
jgi:hypothetical protein